MGNNGERDPASGITDGSELDPPRVWIFSEAFARATWIAAAERRKEEGVKADSGFAGIGEGRQRPRRRRRPFFSSSSGMIPFFSHFLLRKQTAENDLVTALAAK